MTEEEKKRCFAEFQEAIARSCGMVKMVCLIANSVAHVCMDYAIDKGKTLGKWRCDGRLKRAYNRSAKEWSDYERGLLHGEIRFFHIDDMDAEMRNQYGDITDRDYYDFWSSIGGVSYEALRPHVFCLANKYRVSMERHGVHEAEALSWQITAMVMLDLAVKVHKFAVDGVIKETRYPRKAIEMTFACFSIRRVREAFDKVLDLYGEFDYELDEQEKKNITMSIEQIEGMLGDPDIMYESVQNCVENYEEVFRTKGEHKKALKKIAAIRENVVEQFKNQMRR